MVTVRVFDASEWPLYKQLRLSALADAPQAFGSTLAAEALRTDEQWSSRLASAVGAQQHLPLLAEVDGQPAGLAWGRQRCTDPAVAHLHQVWVAPRPPWAGGGPNRPSEAAIAWHLRVCRWIILTGVTCGDTPATRLYTRAGFVLHGAPEPLRPGGDVLFQPMRLALRPAPAA